VFRSPTLTSIGPFDDSSSSFVDVLYVPEIRPLVVCTTALSAMTDLQNKSEKRYIKKEEKIRLTPTEIWLLDAFSESERKSTFSPRSPIS
jgi:hypothetical protein